MKKTKNPLEHNLWKFFLFNLTQRRHFIPILAVFFLTLPNTDAKQIGIYLGAGFLASFLFEIPSGYFADEFGHKKTLILAKIFMILSMFSFIFADSLIHFILGSALLSISFSFTSGTDSAFIHDTLVELKREKEFTKIMSKLLANVSMISAILIILLPFLTKISIILPLKVNLIFDFLGLIAVLSLKSPKREGEIIEGSSFFNIVKKATNPGFYILAIFTGAIGGFIIGSTSFKEVYLQSLGFPIIFLGFVMGLSRVIWFIIGHYAHHIEKKIGLKQLLKLEIIIFPLLLISAAAFTNYYLVALSMILYVGYFFGRSQITKTYFINKLITNKRYKATMLSVKNQISLTFQTIVAFLIGFIMIKSYRLGFFVMGGILFLILLVTYFFLAKYLEK